MTCGRGTCMFLAAVTARRTRSTRKCPALTPLAKRRKGKEGGTTSTGGQLQLGDSFHWGTASTDPLCPMAPPCVVAGAVCTTPTTAATLSGCLSFSVSLCVNVP